HVSPPPCSMPRAAAAARDASGHSALDRAMMSPSHVRAARTPHPIFPVSEHGGFERAHRAVRALLRRKELFFDELARVGIEVGQIGLVVGHPLVLTLLQCGNR